MQIADIGDQDPTRLYSCLNLFKSLETKDCGTVPYQQVVY